ncbi:rhodanese-like domain-containing protein [Maribellus sediminis]|uniref:rhodanese-like domain-containing protein n=1 Tax=Maribellus sediminis TaxID=2696285 RepID=UPI00142F6E8B|nr:rhodanese-like domain-containing protein [Maribellus sediminis]
MIRKLSWIIAFLLLIVVLVLVQTFNPNLFKRNVNDALKAAQQNTVSVQELSNINGDYTIIEFDEDRRFNNSVYIPFNELTQKENKEKLAELKGAVLLYSKDISTSSKAWVILNQLGFDSVFILSEEENPEVLNYKFRPDPTIRPE